MAKSGKQIIKKGKKKYDVVSSANNIVVYDPNQLIQFDFGGSVVNQGIDDTGMFGRVSDSLTGYDRLTANNAYSRAGLKKRDSDPKNILGDLGKGLLNYTLMPFEALTGSNFYDPKMKTSLGKSTMQWQTEVMTPVQEAAIQVGLNSVTPGLGTAVSSGGKAVGQFIPDQADTRAQKQARAIQPNVAVNGAAYQDTWLGYGGNTPGGDPKKDNTYYTSNPEDPRIKAYADSMRLYDFSSLMGSRLSEKYNPTGFYPNTDPAFPKMNSGSTYYYPDPRKNLSYDEAVYGIGNFSAVSKNKNSGGVPLTEHKNISPTGIQYYSHKANYETPHFTVANTPEDMKKVLAQGNKVINSVEQKIGRKLTPAEKNQIVQYSTKSNGDIEFSILNASNGYGIPVYKKPVQPVEYRPEEKTYRKELTQLQSAPPVSRKANEAVEHPTTKKDPQNNASMRANEQRPYWSSKFYPEKAFGGMTPPQYEAEGGEVIEHSQGPNPMAFNGQVQQNSNDFSKIQGPSHEQGGVPMAGGERVYSDRIKVPGTKQTFAQAADEISKKMGKLEKFKKGDPIRRKTAELQLSRYKEQMNQLFNTQEQLKADFGIGESMQKMGNGGWVPDKEKMDYVIVKDKTGKQFYTKWKNSFTKRFGVNRGGTVSVEDVSKLPGWGVSSGSGSGKLNTNGNWEDARGIAPEDIESRGGGHSQNEKGKGFTNPTESFQNRRFSEKDLREFAGTKNPIDVPIVKNEDTKANYGEYSMGSVYLNKNDDDTYSIADPGVDEEGLKYALLTSAAEAEGNNPNAFKNKYGVPMPNYSKDRGDTWEETTNYAGKTTAYQEPKKNKQRGNRLQLPKIQLSNPNKNRFYGTPDWDNQQPVSQQQAPPATTPAVTQPAVAATNNQTAMPETTSKTPYANHLGQPDPAAQQFVSANRGLSGLGVNPFTNFGTWGSYTPTQANMQADVNNIQRGAPQMNAVDPMSLGVNSFGLPIPYMAPDAISSDNRTTRNNMSPVSPYAPYLRSIPDRQNISPFTNIGGERFLLPPANTPLWLDKETPNEVYNDASLYQQPGAPSYSQPGYEAVGQRGTFSSVQDPKTTSGTPAEKFNFGNSSTNINFRKAPASSAYDADREEQRKQMFFGDMMSYLPAAYNMWQGLAAKKDYVKPIYHPYERQMLSQMGRMRYNIEPELTNNRIGLQGNMRAARDASSTSANTYMQYMLAGNRQKQLSDAQSYANKQNMDNQYLMAGMQMQDRLGLNRQGVDMDTQLKRMQLDALQRSFVAKGLEQTAGASQINRQMFNQEMQDRNMGMMMQMLMDPEMQKQFQGANFNFNLGRTQ